MLQRKLNVKRTGATRRKRFETQFTMSSRSCNDCRQRMRNCAKRRAFAFRPILTFAAVTQLGREQSVMEPRLPVPPFTRETAIQKVRLAEDDWNTRDR